LAFASFDRSGIKSLNDGDLCIAQQGFKESLELQVWQKDQSGPGTLLKSEIIDWLERRIKY